jgi:hypothetical protein
MRDPARTVLGYLAAFSLGVVCTGVIMFVSSRRQRGTEGPIPTATNAISEPVKPRQTFQRRLVRGPAAPAADLPPPPVDSLPREEQVDAPPADPIEVVAPPVLETVIPAPVRNVRQQVGGITGDRRALARGGRLSGKVRFLAEPPPERSLPLDPTCGRNRAKLNIPPYTRFFVIGKDHGLGDVVVNIRLRDEGGNWSPPRLAHKIEERNCLFEPYVSAIQAGQPVIVENHDSVLHNLRLSSVFNGEFNRAQLPNRTHKFDFKKREDFVRFKCDVHPWEYAYVSVFDHPYFAVTDKNGIFVIQGVPSGKYVLEARHRKAGTLLKDIEVEANRNIDVQLDFETIAAESSLNAGI